MLRARGPSPEPPLAEPRRANWVERTRHVLAHRPGRLLGGRGRDGGMVGCATSFTRETDVVPGDVRRAARACRARASASRCSRPRCTTAGAACAGCSRRPSDPKAVRRYHAAGFSLHPQMYLPARVDRSALPVVEKVREGSAGDIDLMDSIDRQTAAPPTAPTTSDAGHVPAGRVRHDDRARATPTSTSAARRAARRDQPAYRRPGCCGTALAAAGERSTVSHVTGRQQWAVDVGLAARLELHQEGYLGLRGMKPPAPYLHHGALLVTAPVLQRPRIAP